MYTDYEADSRIIDKLMVIHAGLTQDSEIVKQAGIADQLGGVFNTIQSTIKKRVARDGILATLATYLSPFALGRIWSPLYVLIPVASWFGFDIGAVFKWVIDAVSSIISSTGNFTQDDAKSIADQATSNITSAASLEPLRMLEKRGLLADAMEGKLIKDAQYRRRGVGLGNIFRSFGRGRISKVLFGGILRWFIMAVLFGVAAFEGPKMLGLTGGGEKEETTEQSETGKPSLPGVPDFVAGLVGAPGKQFPESQRSSVANIPPKSMHNFKAQGDRGTQYHVNNGSTMWVVPRSSSVSNTLAKWATYIYPELSGREQELKNSPSFNQMVSAINSISNSRDYFRIPTGLTSWKDVVDRFVGDLA